jgi:hypothetical protein
MKALVFSLWVCLPLSLVAQSTGSIVGTVTDHASKESLCSATVLLSGTKFSATADVDGRFTLHGVPFGKHKLTVSFPGFLTAEKEIVVLPDSTVALTFELEYNDGPTATDAIADLTKGIVRIYVNAWPGHPKALDSLTGVYGFKYQFTGCFPMNESRYNQVVYSYLDSLNGGPKWREDFERAEELIYKRWQPVR